MPIDAKHEDLQSLRIDRSARTGDGEPPVWARRYILAGIAVVVLLGVVATAYRLLSHDTPEVEVVRAAAQSSDVGGVVLSASGYIVAHHKINLNSKVTGRVKLISNGIYRNRGPASPGMLVDMGPTVVLDTGKVEIVVISRHVEPMDMNCLLSLGIDPTQKRFLMLKSRVHWRAGFKLIAKETIECAGTGVCTFGR